MSSNTSQCFFHLFFYFIKGLRRLKTGGDPAITIDQEFSEIPLDIAVVPVIPVHLPGNPLHHQAYRTGESRKCGVLRQVLIERNRVLAVDVDLGELRKGDAEPPGAEGMDLLVAARRLFSELVAWKIEAVWRRTL